jgi:metallo-beta-lactamase class B
VFDNLYYVGVRMVGAWAITTSDGIILIDSLDNPTEARDYIASGLTKLGLDPKSIKYVIVTHAHGDHYGGAQYLHDTYGAHILMSDADWNELAHPRPAPAGRPGPPRDWGPPPSRDWVLTDGEKLTLGDTTVTIVLTPGHTPGTVSVIFPVKDHGTVHNAALWGGTAQPAAPAASLQYEQSLQHFAQFTDRAGVDVEVSNHPLTDDGLARITAIGAGQTNGKNPFVVGTAVYKRYMEIHKECLLAARARPAASAPPPARGGGS